MMTGEVRADILGRVELFERIMVAVRRGEELGISVSALSQKIGSKDKIRAWIVRGSQGKPVQKVAIEDLRVIARATGVNEKWLIHELGEPFAKDAPAPKVESDVYIPDVESGMRPKLTGEVEAALAEGAAHATQEPALKYYGDLPNIHTLLREAQKRRPDIERWVWERLPTTPIVTQGRVAPTVHSILGLAEYLAENDAPPADAPPADETRVGVAPLAVPVPKRSAR